MRCWNRADLAKALLCRCSSMSIKRQSESQMQSIWCWCFLTAFLLFSYTATWFRRQARHPWLCQLQTWRSCLHNWLEEWWLCRLGMSSICSDDLCSDFHIFSTFFAVGAKKKKIMTQRLHDSMRAFDLHCNNEIVLMTLWPTMRLICCGAHSLVKGGILNVPLPMQI